MTGSSRKRRDLVDAVAVALLKLEMPSYLSEPTPSKAEVAEAAERHWNSWAEFMRDGQREKAKALLDDVAPMIVKYYSDLG